MIPQRPADLPPPGEEVVTWTHVVAAGGPVEPVLDVIREVGAEEVIVLGSGSRAAELGARLAPLGIKTGIRRVDEGPIIGTVSTVESLVQERPQDEALLVNLAGARRWEVFGLVSAAFATGLPAVRVAEGDPRVLPTLWFDYEVQLGADEWEVIRGFRSHDAPLEGMTLDELAETTSLSRGQISYRVRGGDGTPGLESMGLVSTVQNDTEVLIALTALGEACLEGSPWAVGERRESRDATTHAAPGPPAP